MSCNNDRVELRFTKSARKHKIGRARAVYIVEHPFVVVAVARPGAEEILMHLGDDETGRAFEVGVVQEGDTYVVIHAMGLREKYRVAYETGKRAQQ